MTDAAYCLRETEKERKSLARMSRYKKSGSKTNYVQLRQTNMTHKEWKKMNGAVESVKLNSPMSKGEFRALSKGMRKLYLDSLIKKYNPRAKDVADMLGYSCSGFWYVCNDLYGYQSNPFPNKSGKPSQEWLDFLNPPEPVDILDDQAEDAEPSTVTVKDDAPTVANVPAEPPVMNVNNVEMTANGDPWFIFSKFLSVLDAKTEYNIHISASPKNFG